MDAMTNQPHEEALKALQGAYPYAMIVGEVGDKKLEPDAKKLNEGGFGAPACIIFKHSPHLVKYFHAEEGKSYPPDVPPVFGKWLAHFGEIVQEWIASEMYVYSPSYLYGGTLDAIGTIDGQNVLLDWKTTTRVRASGTTKKKDDLRYKSHATQLGGYWLALSEMELDFEMPTSACVCYVMHDSDEIDIHWIDLEASVEAFKASLACYNATGGLFLK